MFCLQGNVMLIFYDNWFDEVVIVGDCGFKTRHGTTIKNGERSKSSKDLLMKKIEEDFIILRPGLERFCCNETLDNASRPKRWTPKRENLEIILK
jgi:hypothetical protein